MAIVDAWELIHIRQRAQSGAVLCCVYLCVCVFVRRPKPHTCCLCAIVIKGAHSTHAHTHTHSHTHTHTQDFRLTEMAANEGRAFVHTHSHTHTHTHTHTHGHTQDFRLTEMAANEGRAVVHTHTHTHTGLPPDRDGSKRGASCRGGGQQMGPSGHARLDRGTLQGGCACAAKACGVGVRGVHHRAQR